MLRNINSFESRFRFQHANADELFRAFKAIIRENPHIFWLNGAAKANRTTQNGFERDISLIPKYTDGTTPASAKAMSEKLNKTVQLIVQKAKAQKTVFEMVLYIHDYIAHTTEYSTENELCFTAYGCLINHRACCAGYAKAFQLIAEKIGFDCGYVSGSSKGNNSLHSKHAWNYIKLGGEYYFIDVTWDDPTVIGDGVSSGVVTRDYFCLSERELLLTHNIDKSHYVPYCSGTRYNYYNYAGYFAGNYSYNTVKQIAQTQLRKKNGFSVKFYDRTELEKAKKDLIDNEKVYSFTGIGSRISILVSQSGLILTVNNC